MHTFYTTSIGRFGDPYQTKRTFDSMGEALAWMRWADTPTLRIHVRHDWTCCDELIPSAMTA